MILPTTCVNCHRPGRFASQLRQPYCTPARFSCLFVLPLHACLRFAPSLLLRSDSRNKLLVRRQALKILRGARELLNRRARELREQAEEAFRLVESADKAELAHGATAAEEAAAGEGGEGAAAAAAAPVAEHPAGPEEPGQQRQQDVGQPAAVQQQQQLSERPDGGAAATVAAADGAGSGRTARPSGRSAAGAGAGSGCSVQTVAAGEGCRGSGGATSWRSGGMADGSDGEEGEDDGAALDAPPEAEQPPDAWRFGGLAGVHLLDQPEDVRQMVGLLLGQQAQQAQHGQQAQQAGQQYEFFGFAFDTVATGSAAGVAALLPKGPTAAQRRDNAAHDKQSAGGRRAGGGKLQFCCAAAMCQPALTTSIAHKLCPALQLKLPHCPHRLTSQTWGCGWRVCR